MRTPALGLEGQCWGLNFQPGSWEPRWCLNPWSCSWWGQQGSKSPDWVLGEKLERDVRFLFYISGSLVHTIRM